MNQLDLMIAREMDRHLCGNNLCSTQPVRTVIENSYSHLVHLQSLPHLGIVLRHAVPFLIQLPQVDLRICIALLGQRSPLSQGGCKVAAVSGIQARLKIRTGGHGETDDLAHNGDGKSERHGGLAEWPSVEGWGANRKAEPLPIRNESEAGVVFPPSHESERRLC